MRSIVIPVYQNEASLPELLTALGNLAESIGDLEVVFVIDGSPDRSHEILKQQLPRAPFASQLLQHSRNFGSFAAIRTGLAAARGDYIAVMAADLQEPPELVADFFRELGGNDVDVVLGSRTGRSDPLPSRIASSVFWFLYRTLVIPEIPKGGVDVFACSRCFRDNLLKVADRHSSLIGQIFWLGFRRRVIAYRRLPRRHGRSAWGLRRKLTYMLDSVFAFSDLPIRLLLAGGLTGVAAAVLMTTVIIVLKLTSQLVVPGYAATMIAVLFFGALNAFGLGIIGAYLWRAYANTQARPLAVIMSEESFDGAK